MSNQPMSSTNTVVLHNGSTAQALQAGQSHAFKAKAGEHYRILKRKDGEEQLQGDVIAKRSGDDLQLSYADGTQVTLENYYAECRVAACDVTLPGEGGGYHLNADDAAGAALGDGSTLVYAHGSQDVLMGMAQDNAVLHATLSGIDGADITYTPVASGFNGIAHAGPWSVLGAGFGGAGGGSAIAAVLNNIVTGAIVAGPVVAGNDLTVKLYQSDGITLLGTGAVNASGTFSIDVGSYTGAVIAKLDNGGSASDYIDEATGLARDISASLMAVGVAASGTVTLNINALTTVAATKVGAVFGGASAAAISADAVTQVNAAVAGAFGLSDLTGTVVVTTVDASGATNAGYTPEALSAGEKYGAVLAALSGVDAAHGGNMQRTIDDLVTGLAVSGSIGNLNTASLDAVILGASTAAAKAGGTGVSSLTGVLSNLLVQTSTSVTIDNISTDNLISASEQIGTVITGTSVAGAAVSLSLGGNLVATTVSGTTWSHVLTADDIAAMGEGGETISATATLSGGGTASATRNIVVDTKAPSVIITHSEVDIATGKITYTFTFSETVLGFDASDVVLSSGTKGEFTVLSGSLYTLLVTPASGGSVNAGITVGSGAYTDGADNTGGAGTTPAISVDTLAPTLVIASNASALKAGASGTITFNFSEVPIGFTAGDVATGNGTLSNLSVTADLRVYTATFTPTPGLAGGSASITVASGAYLDFAGNAGGAGATPIISIDTLAPTIAIATSDSRSQIGAVAQLTFTLSEAATDFAAADIAVTGGALSNFAKTDSTHYTADFTPTFGSTSATINVAAGKFSDAAGNGNTAATQLSFSVDTNAPTIAITTDDSALKIGDVAHLTFTLSEAAAADLASGDISVSGGVLTNFVKIDGTHYTADFTPTSGSTAAATVNVDGGKFRDAAGNGNTAATPLNLSVDTVAPTITIETSDSALKIGDVAHLTFTLSEAAAADLASGDISVSGGVLTNFVKIDGTHYTADFTPTSGSTAAATVNVDGGKFRDAAGNGNTAATPLNLSVDTVAPAAAGIAVDTLLNASEASSAVALAVTPAPDATVVSVKFNGNALQAGQGGGYSFDASTLADGDYTVEVTTADVAGNVTTTLETVTVDKTAPAAAGIAVDTLLNASEASSAVALAVTPAPDATVVSVKFNGNALQAGQGGGYGFDASTLADGDYTVEVKTTDVAGNVTTTLETVTVDKTAPALARIAVAGATDGLNFTEATSAVAVSIIPAKGATIVSARIGDTALTLLNGAYSFDARELAQGEHTVSVVSRDTAGNQTITNQAIRIDTLAPTLAITSDVSAVKAGESAAITFTFSEDPGSSFAWDGSIGDVVVTGGRLGAISGSGLIRTATFAPTANLASGSASITAASGTYFDAAGNMGGAGTTPSISIDTLVPTLAITSSVDALKAGEFATITFTFSDTPRGFTADDVVTSDGTLSGFAVTSDPTVYSATFTPTANLGSGGGSITVAAGSYFDAAGNAGIAGTAPIISIDTLAPTLTVGSVHISADSGTLDTDFTTNVAVQTITGTLSGALEMGDKLYGSIDNGAHWIDITAKASGAAISWDGATLAGSSTILFKITDAAGNDSAVSGDTAYVLDTVADAPTLALTSDSGSSHADRISNIGTLTFSNAESGASVEFSADHGVTWSATFAPVEGLNAVKIRQTDVAGNVSTSNVEYTFTYDTSAPTLTVSGVDISADSGVSDTDFNTRTAAQTITATLSEALASGDLLYGSVDDGAHWIDITGKASGTAISWDGAILADGANFIQFKVTDAAGNDGSASGGRSYVLDTVAPFAPTVALAQDGGASNADLVTRNGSLSITNTECGDLVEYSIDQGATWQSSFALVEGGNALMVREVDLAGNASAGTSFAFTYDTTAPGAPGTALIAAAGGSVVDGAINASNTHLTAEAAITAGSATGGSAVLKIDGVVVATDNSIAEGDTSVTFSTSDGSPTSAELQTAIASGGLVTVELTDLAGNMSASSVGNPTLLRDITAPTLTISSPPDGAMSVAAGSNIVLTFSENVAAGSGNIVISNGASDTRTIAIGDSTQVAISGNTVTVNPTGNLLGGGAYNVQMAAGVLQDAAGNAYAGIADAGTLNFTALDPAVNLSAIAAGTGGFVINGRCEGEQAGFSVAGVGDVNGDGLDDLLVGAPHDNALGYSYVVFGKADGSAIDLSAVAAGTGGFMINGPAVNDAFGQRVAAAGDVNGDGLADLIVGAPNGGSGSSGNSYVVFGKSDTAAVDISTIAAGTGGFIINGENGSDRSGNSVAAAGDVNGDGLADLIVGARDASNGSRGAGRSYVVFGNTTGSAIDLSAIAAGTGGFVIGGENQFDGSGASVAGAGDVNGDGLADLIVGAPGADPAGGADAGRSYVLFGKTETGSVSLANVLAGIGGFAIDGENSTDHSGQVVSGAGDINGDGLADLFVTAPGSYPYGVPGTAYVVFGQAGTSTVSLSAVAAGTGGFVVHGESAHGNAVANDGLGLTAATSAGDINGDGLADLIIGAKYSDNYAGRSYVVFGKTGTGAIELSSVAAGTGGFVIKAATDGDRSGSGVAAAGDVNGDGLADLIVSAIGAAAPGGNIFGRSYVIFGSTAGAFAQTAIDQLGTSADDVLSGSSIAETLVGGAGNDTLTGNGGADVLYGGAGNDVFVVNAGNVAALALGVTDGQLARIDGGSGIDTLQLDGAGIALNLNNIANQGGGTPGSSSRIESIERIDITGSGDNALTVGVRDVQDMAGMNLINSATQTALGWTNGSYSFAASVGRHQLIVDGNGGDVVNINGGNWTAMGTAFNHGVTYNVYNSDAGLVQVLVANGITANVQMDTVAPTIVIGSADSALIIGDVAHLTFTLSEAALDFAAADIAVTGGALSGLTAVSSTVYTASFTPTANSTAAATIDVAGGSFSDAAGNGNTAATQLNLSVDTVAPTIVITSNDSALSIGEAATLTFTLSEAALDFAEADIAVTGGALSGFTAVSDSVYTANFTPTANSTAAATIDVAGATFTDAAGNGNTAATQLSLNVDTTAPTIAITSNDSALKIGDVAQLTFTLSEAATNFAEAGIAVTGGALSGFTAVSSTVYTASFTPTANSTVAATINVAGTTFTDAAGNGNTAATQLNLNVDTVAPTVLISSNYSALKIGESAMLTFRLSEAATNFAAADIAVTGGTLGNFSAVSGTTYRASFTPRGNWTAPATINVAGGGFSDAAGNGNVAAQRNLSVDTVAPTIVIASDDSALIIGDVAHLTFTLSEASTTFAAAAIAVTGGALSGLTAVSSTVYTASFTPTANSTAAATINVAGATFTDAAGNGNKAAMQLNLSVDTIAPTLASSNPSDNATAVAAAGNIVLTFSENVAAGSGDIVISNGASDIRTIAVGDGTQVTISGNTVTINPTADLLAGGAYSVQMAAGVLQDSAGNLYAGIADAGTLNFVVAAAAAPVFINLSDLGTGGFVINGQGASDQSGISVASAGDVNGDGLGDLIVGAKYSNIKAGHSYVVFGKAGTVAVELSDIAAGTGGFIVNGQCSGDQSGVSVASAGDVNGDGLMDLIVGAHSSDPITGSNAGRSYVVFGKADGGQIDLSAIAAGSGGFVINGQSANDNSGRSVASAGDVNGDGLADLIIGVADRDLTTVFNAGSSYIVFGKSTGSPIELSSIEAGAGGFVINGQCSGDNSGFSVAGAGDVNGDGLTDLIVGAIGGTPTSGLYAGRSYVVFGKAETSAIDLAAIEAGSGGFVINGQCADDQSGWSVAGAGDVNGDGLADLIVGAKYGYAGFVGAGRSYVVFGKTGTAAIDLSAIAAGMGGFVINGQGAGDQSGFSVASAGDINGDGLMDLIVGAKYGGSTSDRFAGRSYVVFGKTGTSAIDLSAIAAGTGGFVINGQCADDNSGFSVASAGDVNGDGLADLIVGAPFNAATATNAGRSYVIFGSTTGAFAQTAIDQLGTSADDVLSGSSIAETLVGGAGNDTLTGNGGADVLYGGAGGDLFVVNESNVAALALGVTDGQLARIDGGSGIDTFRLDGTAIAFDLTSIANQGGSMPGSSSRIESIERIDLTGTGNNTLTLGLKDVFDMAGMNSFNNFNGWADGSYNLAAGGANGINPEQRHQLVVDGNAGDAVNSSGWGATVGSVMNGGHAYDVYNQGLHAQLLIEQTMSRTVI